MVDCIWLADWTTLRIVVSNGGFVKQTKGVAMWLVIDCFHVSVGVLILVESVSIVGTKGGRGVV